MLPSCVRDLILQDRGYSIYLSESFAQLPSPVNESMSMKKCFKDKADIDTTTNNNKKGKKGGRDL
jgi:hypothetical protein